MRYEIVGIEEDLKGGTKSCIAKSKEKTNPKTIVYSVFWKYTIRR